MLGDDDRAELCDSLPIAYMRWDVAEWRWGCLRLERSAVGRGARYVLSLSVLRMTELRCCIVIAAIDSDTHSRIVRFVR